MIMPFLVKTILDTELAQLVFVGGVVGHESTCANQDLFSLSKLDFQAVFKM